MRILPYWHDHIAPSIRSGQNVLICVHGTAVRALIKYLDQVSDDDISKIDVPTGLFEKNMFDVMLVKFSFVKVFH